MKTTTQTATKQSAETKKVIQATINSVAPKAAQPIKPVVYGFVIRMLADKAGDKVRAFIARAKKYHDDSGTIFPRVAFERNAHSKMTDSELTQSLDAWKALVDLGQGGKVANTPFSKALYDSFRVIQGNYK